MGPNRPGPRGFLDLPIPIDGLYLGYARLAATWIGPGNAEFDPNYKGVQFDPAKVSSSVRAALAFTAV